MYFVCYIFLVHTADYNPTQLGDLQFNENYIFYIYLLSITAGSVFLILND